VDLEPEVAKELDRHLAVAKDWYPHEYVPYSDGRTFDGILGGLAWSPEDSKIPDVARTSLIVNLLTEDNLPSYHFEIAHSFGRDGAWGTWVHRWTAEEDRHGAVLRDYLTVTRAVDPVALENARMVHMSTGFRNSHETMLHSLAYVSFQELATRISHRNTGAASKDPICEQMMTRIATDENLHMIFYRNLLQGALDLSPSQTLRAIVATSTLELGIDMGAVDLVVQVEAPDSVANGLQRIGRAGHQVGAPSVGKLIPKYRGDLLQTAVVAERMLAADDRWLQPAGPQDRPVPWHKTDCYDCQSQKMSKSQNVEIDLVDRVDQLFQPVRDVLAHAGQIPGQRDDEGKQQVCSRDRHCHR